MTDFPVSSVASGVSSGHAARRMPTRKRLNLRLAVLVFGVAAVGCFGGWLFQSRINNFWADHVASLWSSSGSAASIVSSSELVSRSGSLHRPIFWVGAQAGSEYELTTTADGRSFVRYLQVGESAGVAKAALTVAAYPMANAYNVSATVAGRPGVVRVQVPSGVAFYERSHPQSVYLAFAGSDYQVELFDPTPLAALRLARSGAVQPVVKLTSISSGASSSAAGVYAVTASRLASIAARSGQRVYWAGRRSGTTEYRAGAGGRVYVRYLPEGVGVAAAQPYLTLATYPLKNAYATTRTLSRRANAVALKVVKGAG